MKKSISLILCLCMLLTSFAACAKENTPETEAPAETSSVSETDTVSSEATAEAVPEETKTVYKSNVPEGTDYGGMSFTVVSFPESAGVWGDCDWSATDITGEVFNDAVYTRTSNVEDLLNIDVKTEYCADANDTKMLATSVKAADDAYQLYSISPLPGTTRTVSATCPCSDTISASPATSVPCIKSPSASSPSTRPSWTSTSSPLPTNTSRKTHGHGMC